MWMVCGTVAPSQLSVRVGKLLQGNSYLFRVFAENRVGTGPPEELEQPVIPRLPFGMLLLLYIFAQVLSHICMDSLMKSTLWQCVRPSVCHGVIND